MDEITYEILELDEIGDEVISGVYLMFQGDDLTYIGQSRDVLKRLKSHGNTFDDALIIKAIDGRKGMEKDLIEQYRPINNVVHNPDNRPDREPMKILPVGFPEKVRKWIKQKAEKKFLPEAGFVRQLVIEAMEKEKKKREQLARHD